MKICESASYTGSQILLDFSSATYSTSRVCSCNLKQVDMGRIIFHNIFRPGLTVCGSSIYVKDPDMFNPDLEIGCKGDNHNTTNMTTGKRRNIELKVLASPFDSDFCYKLQHGR